MKEAQNISSASQKKIQQTQEKIFRDLNRLAKEKFTGQVTIKIVLNQGGVRDSKIIMEKSL